MSSAMNDNDAITLGHKNKLRPKIKSREENNSYHFEQRPRYFSISSRLSHGELSEMKHRRGLLNIYIYQPLISPLREQKNYAEKL